jgi:enoyl-CoA hydratase/carnithine racemase
MVLFGRDGPVAIIRLQREQKLNALNRAMLDAVMAQLDEVARDDALHVVILTGTGRAFCAGADIGEYWPHGPGAFADYQRRGRLLLERVEKHPCC